jgi:hypothetical protein
MIKRLIDFMGIFVATLLFTGLLFCVLYVFYVWGLIK